MIYSMMTKTPFNSINYHVLFITMITDDNLRGINIVLNTGYIPFFNNNKVVSNNC
jgi:hypothetical protein